jgi:hypothetical protein
MVSNGSRNWSWTLRRLGISAFLVVHLGATALWVIPPCPLRSACFGPVSCYMLPLGLWQFWSMFSPDPVRETLFLEADLIDSHGLRFAFAFPKLADFSKWGAVPRFRHSKYAVNLSIAELEIQRELAARHVVRQIGVPASSFPVDVHLIYQVRPTPPPGSPPVDPMTPTHPYLIGTYHFASLSEVHR